MNYDISPQLFLFSIDLIQLSSNWIWYLILEHVHVSIDRSSLHTCRWPRCVGAQTVVCNQSSTANVSKHNFIDFLCWALEDITPILYFSILLDIFRNLYLIGIFMYDLNSNYLRKKKSKIKGEVRSWSNLISEERVKFSEQNSENLMKIGWKIRKLWNF